MTQKNKMAGISEFLNTAQGGEVMAVDLKLFNKSSVRTLVSDWKRFNRPESTKRPYKSFFTFTHRQAPDVLELHCFNKK